MIGPDTGQQGLIQNAATEIGDPICHGRPKAIQRGIFGPGIQHDHIVLGMGHNPHPREV